MTGPDLPTAPPGEPAWVTEVLDFWFTELDRKAWFTADPAGDAAIIQRFGRLQRTLAAHEPEPLLLQPRTALAAVIVLDQFRRNMFRGTPAAFATDAAALALARGAIAAGLDAHLSPDGRLFLYLPFEHSEAAADQQLAVDLISALGDAELTRYALAHKAIIDRFGRFPHRNATLGRLSTPEELAFLLEPGSSF